MSTQQIDEVLMFVALVGPDGAGKTTVATAVEQAGHQAGLRFAYVHYRPNLGAPERTVPIGQGPPPEKNRRPARVTTSERVKSLGRLGLNWLRFWGGYLWGIRRHVAGLRGPDVILIADRWIYNFVAQPDSVAYYGPHNLARIAVWLAPRPDVTVILHVPAQLAVSRKGELSLKEAEDELSRWLTLKFPNRVAVVDATATPNAIAQQILHVMSEASTQHVRRLRRYRKSSAANHPVTASSSPTPDLEAA